MYITTQAPMETTIPDFWRMVWERQCSAIVMLTLTEENGKAIDLGKRVNCECLI